MSINPFDYADPSLFLAESYRLKRERNPSFSLRSWARQLGVDSPSTMWRLVHGKSLPGKALIRKLSENLKLTPDQAAYFEFTVFAKKSGQDCTALLDSIWRASFESQMLKELSAAVKFNPSQLDEAVKLLEETIAKINALSSGQEDGTDRRYRISAKIFELLPEKEGAQ